MSSGIRNRFFSGPGGITEVLRLALPLVISNSFWTLQITIDRILLSRFSSDTVGAALAAGVLYWCTFTLFMGTAMYTATFVAQYIGAKRPKRIGSVMWQSLYFSTAAGLLFLLLLPWVDGLVSISGHSSQMQSLEVIYFRCLCFAALPMLLTASATSFFLGRGKNWTVMIVNAAGLIINAFLDYAWIEGNLGFPQWGITGAGWATVAGSWASALMALALLFRPRYFAEFGLASGWRLDIALFRRLMWFGIPSGLQWMMEGLAFNIVILFIGRIGDVELSASGIAFTLNMLAFIPTMGLGQAASILVGQRLGENKPELAARSTWSSFALAWILMAVIGLSFVLAPGFYLSLFQTQNSDGNWQAVAALTPILLRFVALYCLFDSLNVVFSFALKGAGDTRFVTLITILAAWPLMVFPTWIAYQYNLSVYWAWYAVTAYVFALGLVFLLRFLQGKWKMMRVIEAVPKDADAPANEASAAEPEKDVWNLIPGSSLNGTPDTATAIPENVPKP